MLVANFSEERAHETSTWSDPFVELQFQKFCRTLNEADPVIQQQLAEGKTQEHAEYILNLTRDLCEWSRQLLNRGFGRTTPQEYSQIVHLFQDAAHQISDWATAVKDKKMRDLIGVYAQHIQSRAS